MFPTSKATTAYELLDEIAALALEEPKRMAMSEWLLNKGDESLPAGFLGWPSCNTVGCIGGWTNMLVPHLYVSQVLGLNVDQQSELCYPDDLVYADNPQTPEHAQAVVEHIHAFQAKYESQLHGHVIPKGSSK
jgi:hypothetical protein